MRASLTGWATVQVQGERALVLPAPDLDALYAGLERALEGQWSVRYVWTTCSRRWCGPACIWAILSLIHRG